MLEDNLEIPAFLDRRTYDAEGKLIKHPTPDFVYSANRIWAPIKSAWELRQKETLDNFYAENPAFPVQVVTTDKRNLNMFDDFEQFKKFHDFDDYPIKRIATAAGMTYVVVKQSNTAILSDEIKDMPKVYHTVVVKNDVKRPKTDSLCGRAWALYDESLTGKRTIAEAMDMLKKGGMNGSTVRTQYAHWRRFNGIAK